MENERCNLCPRGCMASRTATTAGGRCGMPTTARISLAQLHMWEEPPISGTRGSGAVFFSGCSLGCVFCQNHEISHAGAGRELTAAGLAETFRRLETEGAHNINLVTGTHFVPAIIEALSIYRPTVPIVWNSGGYETVETIDRLAPYVDIWLPDYKYGLSDVADRYCRASDYPAVALAALLRMREHAPREEYDGAIIRRGMIIRHLVLPGNTRSSIAALRTIADQLPGVPVSLMSQYTPVTTDPRYPELHRRITAREYDKVCDAALALGLDGFVQEHTSANSCFVPHWEE